MSHRIAETCEQAFGMSSRAGGVKRRIAIVASVALMGALVWANAQPSVAGLISSPWDLLAHAGVFCVLAALLVFAIGRDRLWLALAITIAYAMFDELRQFELPGRTASVSDFVTDLFGIALGTLVGFASSGRYSPDDKGGPDR